jgi:hypothetical protein
VTPVGPRPYDITFTPHPPNALRGAARPGASTHSWTFYEEDEALKLRFLSTFAGNRQPLSLTGVTAREGTVVFRTSVPDFLEVHVTPQAEATAINIILRGKPHVEIYLTRDHRQ